MRFLSDRRRGNLVKLVLSFSGIIFATLVVGAFLASRFNLLGFTAGLILTVFLINVILWLEP